MALTPAQIEERELRERLIRIATNIVPLETPNPGEAVVAVATILEKYITGA